MLIKDTIDKKKLTCIKHVGIIVFRSNMELESKEMELIGKISCLETMMLMTAEETPSKVDVIKKGQYYAVDVTNDTYSYATNLVIDLKEKILVVKQVKIKSQSIFRGRYYALFKAQIHEAKNAGIKILTADCYRARNYNGYYTFLRYGYVPVKGASEKYLKKYEKDKGVILSSLCSLMQNSQGREWWLNNGGSFRGVFNLSKDSYSMRTFEQYFEARNK